MCHLRLCSINVSTRLTQYLQQCIACYYLVRVRVTGGWLYISQYAVSVRPSICSYVCLQMKKIRQNIYLTCLSIQSSSLYIKPSTETTWVATQTYKYIKSTVYLYLLLCLLYHTECLYWHDWCPWQQQNTSKKRNKY